MERLLRSWIFVPGNRQRFIDKALGLGADAFFLDLEDGVPPGEKPQARTLVAEALARPAGGPLRFVRVNAVGSSWFQEDIQAVLQPGLAGICIPKVERPDDVAAVAAHLEEHERRSGKASGSVRIVASIESARGLLQAPAIADSNARLLALMMGAEDFALDLGLATRREREARELLYARSALVIAATAANRVAIDGVFPQLDDDEGLLADAWQARRLGFRAKSTFHPKQIEVLNRVFTPSPDEVAYAERVVEAFQKAISHGEGAVAVGGQLVDRPVVERAQRLLESVQQLQEPGAAGQLTIEG